MIWMKLLRMKDKCIDALNCLTLYDDVFFK